MTRYPAFVLAAALVSAATLASCGGDEEPSASVTADEADAPEPETDEPVAETTDVDEPAETDAEPEATEASGEGAGGTGEEGRATVVLEDGTSYEYSTTAPASDPGAYTYCNSVVDSLQAYMYLVDGSGETTEDGALDVILLEPGGDYELSGDPAELRVGLGVDDRGIPSLYEGTEVGATASGTSGSGSFTAVDDFSGEEITGTLEVTCS